MGDQPNLYIIGDYINQSLLTDSFKTTAVYKEDILNQTFLKAITAGVISVDVNDSNSYDFTDLTWVFTSRNNDQVQVETKLSGSVTLVPKAGGGYESFTATVAPTSTVRDDTSGRPISLFENIVDTNLITVSGTGFFETITDIRSLIESSSKTGGLTLQTLDYNFTSIQSGQLVQIDFNLDTKDNYIVNKIIGTDNSEVQL